MKWGERDNKHQIVLHNNKKLGAFSFSLDWHKSWKFIKRNSLRTVAVDRKLTGSNNPRNPGVMASKGMSF